MRSIIVVLTVLLVYVPLATAKDIGAGKIRATEVCAACHGANGVSVGPDIPNLAGQKAGYLGSQLKAFKSGARKNALMNAIATQLTADDIDNVAAYFASLPGPSASTAVSELLPNVAKTHLTVANFPTDFKATYTRYAVVNYPERPQVRHLYANNVALAAARDGKPLPDGSFIVMEVYAPKLDEQKKPVTGPDGNLVPDKLAFVTAMAREAGWGKDIPAMLRNEDWNYAIFNADLSARAGNQATCLACHKPLPQESYLFSLKQLRDTATKK